MTYVVITFVVLVILNIYCSITCQNLFYQGKKDSMIEKCLLVSDEIAGLDVRVLEDYGLRDFVRAVAEDIEHRCRHCYSIRLGTAAKYAAENGFSAYTSSLLISPYQNHELLREVGESMAKQYGVEFLYRDFRPGFREGQNKARELDLYMQKYCGCVFSEEDRYAKKIEKAAAKFRMP